MCSCGCNTCDTKKALMLNENVAPREILSEGLKYHIDNNKPLTEQTYRAGSSNYFNLWAEARSFYSRGIIEVTNADDLAILTETNLGEFGTLEDGTRVPLDFIMEDEYLDLNEGTFESDEIAIYDDPNGDDGETRIYKRGTGYYGVNDSFDFEAKDKAELETKLKRWGYTLQAGNLDETKNTSLDSETIKQIKNDIDGFPKYQKRGFESFKKEVRERYKITPKQLEDIIHGDLTEAKDKKKDPPIGKPMRDTSGGKAYKVYVRDPKTKRIKTVRFGSGGLKAKINNSKARSAFAKRHKCSTRNDRTKASYWSCRLPRYAKLLGLKSNFTGFW